MTGCTDQNAAGNWHNNPGNIIAMALGAAIIFWALWPASTSNDQDEFPADGATYALHPDGKQYIAEQIETQAKDFCMPTSWHSDAITAANASDDFRRDARIEIPAHLTLSGKAVIIKLHRSHFVRLTPPIIE